MKIPREARKAAKSLFRACQVNGAMDDSKMLQVVNKIAEAKPRQYFAILTRLRKLVSLEVERRTAHVESATPLGAMEGVVTHNLTTALGRPLEAVFTINPALIGGMRIRVGSDVWDGSVRGRLENLQNSL